MSSLDPYDTQAQEKQEADRKAKQEAASRQEIEDFKWLMSEKRGRRIVWGLLEKTGMYRSSFTGNSETFFREGARNIGLIYTGLINDHCLERYLSMVRENTKNDDK